MGIGYHKQAFRQLCLELQGCMRSVTVSFVDRYSGNGYWQKPGKPEARRKSLLRDAAETEMEELAAFFARTGVAYGCRSAPAVRQRI